MKPTPQQKAAARQMRRDHPDMSVRQIAAKLGITVRTVENYISRIYEKTGITSRSGLLQL